jgi:uncharacterized 2Fe-2S/4Fe-4S cluster protein (DUF4445 family)
MPAVTISYGPDVRTIVVAEGSHLSDAVITSGLPLEQACAGLGKCGKCKILAAGALTPFDDVELGKLSAAEQGAGYRLACRTRVLGDASVDLAPLVVYSNKIFRACDDHLRDGAPLGLAIDLGSTTVAAFLTVLDTGRVCAGGAALNLQTVFGADVISRLAAAGRDEANARRLSALALASIGQAIEALRLSRYVLGRVRKATIVGNCAMHHLLLGYPVETLSRLPFQPFDAAAVRQAEQRCGGVFPAGTTVALPPLIGGFVGSDALACLAYFGFDEPPGPMAAMDLGTNGEVMVTDGKRIVVASTAAGPAFEGVNISCGIRAVDGAIVSAQADDDGALHLTTIADEPPVGLTGSGLISLVSQLRGVGLIDPGGRMVVDHPTLGQRMGVDEQGVRRFRLTDVSGEVSGQGQQRTLYLTQRDVRELQKAKAAVRAAMEILLGEVGLEAKDLRRLVLTGSFGSQVDVDAVMALGMIPLVSRDIITAEPNGAGFGAALFLDEQRFARGERLARASRQVDLDLALQFNERFLQSMTLAA